MNGIISDDIKPFHKAFQKLSARHSSDRVFTDFLEFVIQLWRADTTEPKEFSGYDESEATLFYELWVVFANEMKRLVAEHGCYDILGEYYEYIAGQGQRSKFGQYFTPMHVVKMMIGMVVPTKAEIVADPAGCGAGRMLIAAQAENPSRYSVGIDLDRTCCMMTVVNMLLHGCRGEVVHKDGLSNTSYYEGWLINADLWQTFTPSVRKLEKENSLVWQQCCEQQANHELKKQEEQQQKQAEEELKKLKKQKFQTSIF